MNLVLLSIFFITFFFGFLCALCLKKRKKRKHVCIVVLGDVGRSPRMQYHAKSFAQEGFEVDIIGYPGSAPLKELEENDNVNIRYLRQPPDLKDKLSTVLVYIVKVLFQSIDLLRVLITNRRASYLLLQNPPAIPTLPICWLYCCILRVQLAIDWHNYAYSIMSLSLGANHFIVKIALFIESYFGAKAHQNFCVTEAMKNDLAKKWDIKATVLYDRPSNNFHPIDLKEKHELFVKLGKKYNIFKEQDDECSAFTKIEQDKIVLRPERPALLVSSTSWTEDEDFSILLNALDDYERTCDDESWLLPNMICVITGKGPLKEFYVAIVKSRKWKHVTVVTPWLKNEDYPKVLASADLGVCLHTSSSGLDLPMKVVDMFGCGLPVCAYDFKCLNELVKHNKNSLVFSTDIELAEQLKTWFRNFPNNAEQASKCESFKKELECFRQLRWHGNWMCHVLPHFNQ